MTISLAKERKGLCILRGMVRTRQSCKRIVAVDAQSTEEYGTLSLLQKAGRSKRIVRHEDYVAPANFERDVRPPNFLLFRQGEVKLSDFGFSRPFNTL